jgi:hypothetical protein
MRYVVVYSEYLTAFEDEVNRRLAEGWTPQGGLVQSKGLFYQAMVHPGEEQA